jgi:ribosome-associated protein
MRQVYVDDTLTIPYEELEITASRSSGPGGQHVNTTDSRVHVRFDVSASPSLTPELRQKLRERLGGRIDKRGAVRVASQRFRSQIQNREAALARLAQLLRDALLDDAPRVATRPSRSKKEQRLREKHRHAEIKRERTRREWD